MYIYIITREPLRQRLEWHLENEKEIFYNHNHNDNNKYNDSNLWILKPSVTNKGPNYIYNDIYM